MKKLYLFLILMSFARISSFAQTTIYEFVVDCRKGVLITLSCSFEISVSAKPIDIFNIRCTKNCAAFDYDRNYGTLGRAFDRQPYTKNGGKTWIHEVTYKAKKCYDGDNQPASIVEVYY